LEIELLASRSNQPPTPSKILFDTVSPVSYTEHLTAELDKVREKRRRMIVELETFLHM
jgi:hypothetical protein